MSAELAPEQRRAMEYLAKKGSLAPLAKLQQQLRDAFAAMEEALDAVPETERESSPGGKWSAHQILDHLVLSHAPAVAQFESLLAGADGGLAVPADLQSADEEREGWSVLRGRLAAIHRDFLRLIADAGDDVPLDAKAGVEMVVKVSGEPRHWIERLDWKAFVQAIRVHTLEHQAQLGRLREASSHHELS